MGAGVDGAALVEPFNRLAEQGYETAGVARGVNTDLGRCPLLTTTDAVAIAEALGVEIMAEASAVGGALSGIPGSDLVFCGVAVEGIPLAEVRAGTTPDDADTLAAKLDDGPADPEVVEESAGGLDPNDVLGQASGEGFVHAYWLDGGFTVTLMVRPQGIDVEDALRALPIVVDAVARSLE
jgi:hypothetical protein